MPLIGAREVDENAEYLLRKWIRELPHEATKADKGIEANLTTTSGAMETLAELDEGKLSAPQRKTTIVTGLASSNANISALFLRFLPPDQRPQTLGPTVDGNALLKLTGNPKRGAEILSPTGKWAACYACHSIHDVGGKIGPDLSKIASRLDKAQILESLLAPSKTITPEFQAWQIETSDGKTETGFITNQSESDIIFRLADGTTRTITKAGIKKQVPLPTSLMPEGLLQTLTQQEAADVLAWLGSLR